jgi:hypothetical protein
MVSKTMTYEEILQQIRRLEPREQAELLAEIAGLVRQHIPPSPPRSIMELRGLGKEIWRDEQTGELIDAQEYVDRERGKR